MAIPREQHRTKDNTSRGEGASRELRLVATTTPRPPLAERLRAVRKLRGLSLNAAAEITGVCRRTIQESETTDRRLRGNTLSKIARGYQVDVDTLDPDIAFPELPAWKGARKAPAAAVVPPITTWSTLAFLEWRAMTKRVHEHVNRACETIAQKISDHEGELVELRAVLAARQGERASLERALG